MWERAFKLIAGLALLSSLVFQVGCRRYPPVALLPELQQVTPYFKELDRWYRVRRVYHDLDVRFYVEVTYLSRPLLLAYVAEYARVYNLSLEEQRKLYDEKLQGVDTQDTFFVSLYAPTPTWDQLSTEDGYWKLRAVYLPAGTEIKPSQVEEVAESKPEIDYFFPYTEPWARHYRVVVNSQPGAGEVQFTMQGVIGRQEFRWQRP